jgi:hypothetical protein
VSQSRSQVRKWLSPRVRPPFVADPLLVFGYPHIQSIFFFLHQKNGQRGCSSPNGAVEILNNFGYSQTLRVLKKKKFGGKHALSDLNMADPKCLQLHEKLLWVHHR